MAESGVPASLTADYDGLARLRSAYQGAGPVFEARAVDVRGFAMALAAAAGAYAALVSPTAQWFGTVWSQALETWATSTRICAEDVDGFVRQLQQLDAATAVPRRSDRES